jgi:ABC-type molybdenum transport system ATPase subunit/photorepair protein PhrA
MPTPAEPFELSPLQDLRARLVPGALLFALADAREATRLQGELSQETVAWVGWGQRQRLLHAWRPSAQERYSSMAGREAPTLRQWLAVSFRRWLPDAAGISRLKDDAGAVEAALGSCALSSLAESPVSLLSNGEAARACLAAALAQRVSVFVLQDLAEGMDARGRELLQSLGRRLAGEGKAVLFLASRPSLLPQVLADPSRALEAMDPGPGPQIFACRGLNLDAGERPLIRNLDWELRGGEAWWLRGPNGRGKSTLLAYLSGDHPQAWAKSWRLHGLGREAYTPLQALRNEVSWVSPELAAVAERPILELLGEALERPSRLLLLDEALRGLNEASLMFWHQRLAVWMSAERALVFVCHDPAEAPPGLTHFLDL